MPSALSINPTPITPPRVPLIDARTGLIDRAWYMFFLSLFTTAQTTLDAAIEPNTSSQLASYAAELQTLAQVVGTQFDSAAPLASLDAALRALQDQMLTQPPALSGELQQEIDALRQEIQTTPRPALGTMAALQQAWLPWVTFDTTPEFTPTDVGTVAWDGGTTLGVQMTPNVVGHINESAYYYIKASSSITKGDVVMFTGAVGSSGVPTGAPATGVTDGSYIMGVAAESMALNAFGLVQFAGTLKGLNTSAYADGDILWYNPAVAGGLTKTKPTAPNVKVQMAAVINASPGGSGSILIRVSAGSELGGTDSNVQFGPLADKNLIQYDSVAGYWKNVPASSTAIGTATNLAAGAAGSIPYQSAADTTTFLSVGSAGQVLKVNGGGTAPAWTSGAALTKTDDTNVTLTLGGSASTSLLAAASLTLGWTGQLAVSRGGTGLGSFTTGRVFYASSASAIGQSANLTFDGTTLTAAALSGPHNGTVGATTPATGAFTTLTTSSDATISGNMGVGTSPNSTIRAYIRGSDTSGSSTSIYCDNSASTILFYVNNDGLFVTGNAANSPYNKTTSSAANVYIDSNGILYRSTSSARYKTDVQTATHGLSDVLKLRSVTYKGVTDGDVVFGGLLAEEVHAAGLTEFVAYDSNGQPDALHYGNMVGLLVKAIQEQQSIVENLRQRVAALEVR